MINGAFLRMDVIPVKKVSLKNMLPTPSSWSLSGVSVVNFDGYGETFVFSTGGLAMATYPLPTPSVGHLYYGRCIYMSDGGFTCADGRFEYYYTDATNGLMVFHSAVGHDTSGVVETVSGISSISEDISGGSAWTFRNFTVNATLAAYRAQPLLIDLTSSFGSGKEPSKEWCDENIPYFVGTTTLKYL